jgi:succinate dehydrogenase / fumarate reductase flavoprotein subunit
MAEGGIAAALANVDDRDNWKVHFSDTMRGGQYVNNWRMAELHAKEAPGPGARAGGRGERCSIARRMGGFCSATSGATSIRGSRTSAIARAGAHSHPAGSRHSPGHRRAHGAHGCHVAERRRSRGGRARLRAGAGRFKVFKARAVVLATGGIGRAYKITSNSWEYTATDIRWPITRAQN